MAGINEPERQIFLNYQESLSYLLQGMIIPVNENILEFFILYRPFSCFLRTTHPNLVLVLLG